MAKALTAAEHERAKLMAFGLVEKLGDQLTARGEQPCMCSVVLILAAAYAEAGDDYGARNAVQTGNLTADQLELVHGQQQKIQDAKDLIPEIFKEVADITGRAKPE